jgi:RNA-binding protein
MLEPREKRSLKARAHKLRPVVMMGARGLTEAVIRETDQALSHHELIKVKLAGRDRGAVETMAGQLALATGAELVGIIGRIALLYRPRPEGETQTSP